MNPFIEREREEERKRIRTFCASRGADGGMLIVCGPRGCGKTRLVEEALSEACKQSWWCLLFGDSHRRRQPIAARPPRDIPRLLFKVEVDPFFPHPCRRKGDKPEPEPMDPNATAFQLLRNLVFALTSLLDPRLSQRRFGRTLRGRLGFWRYWLSSTALHWSSPPDPDLQWKRSLIVALMLYGMAVALLLPEPFFPAWTEPRWMVFLATVLITLFAWLFLRWRDWRALARFSAQLYDLVHAQDLDKSEQSSRSAGLQVSQQWNLPAIALVLLGLLSIGIGSFPQLSHGVREGMAGNTVKQSAITKPGDQETGATPKTARAPVSKKPDYPTLLGLLTVLLGTGLLVWNRKLGWDESNTAHFGQQNPVWMITQLRRYLFLLHRVGIEPVLVFDELDKLEDDAFVSGRGRSPASVAQSEESVGAMPTRYTPGQLDSFIDAIQRLRQMLAGDFVTILVGGWGLVRSYEQALDGSFPSPLGSIVQEAIYLGPVSPATVEAWWRDRPESHATSPSTPSDPHTEACIAWAFSKGLYARLQGYRRNWTANEYHRDAILLAAKVAREYWEVEDLIGLISAGDRRPWMRHLSRLRVLTLLRIGMTEQAFEHAFGEESSDRATAMLDPDEIEKRIKSTNPEERIAVGRIILAYCLNVAE